MTCVALSVYPACAQQAVQYSNLYATGHAMLKLLQCMPAGLQLVSRRRHCGNALTLARLWNQASLHGLLSGLFEPHPADYLPPWRSARQSLASSRDKPSGAAFSSPGIVTKTLERLLQQVAKSFECVPAMQYVCKPTCAGKAATTWLMTAPGMLQTQS